MEMTVDEVADILYDYLKNHTCPVCKGKLRIEVKRKKSGDVKRHFFRVVCRGCGILVEGDDYANRDLPENPIVLRGIAEELRDQLKNTSRTLGEEIAKKFREDA